MAAGMDPDMTRTSRLPSARTVHVIDGLVVAWAGFCVVLGLWFAAEIRDLRSLPTTLSTAGRGLENAGTALEGLPSVVGGGAVEQVAADARSAGTQARRSATDARAGLETLSVLTAVTVALVPTGAVLLFYVPLRMAWRRQRPRLDVDVG